MTFPGLSLAARPAQPFDPSLGSLPPRHRAATTASHAAGPSPRRQRPTEATATSSPPRQPPPRKSELPPPDTSPLLDLPSELLLAVVDRLADPGANDPAASAKELARFSTVSRETRGAVEEWLGKHDDVQDARARGPATKEAERAAARRASSSRAHDPAEASSRPADLPARASRHELAGLSPRHEPASRTASDMSRPRSSLPPMTATAAGRPPAA